MGVETAEAVSFNISYNEWSYILNTTIDNQFINNLTLQKFNYFILKSKDNNYYFNVKKSNTNTGIEFEYSLDIVEADIYIYDYTPIFMNIGMSYNIYNNTAYVYCNRTDIQRNEIIRLGFYYIQIVKWSVYYNCYIGNILYKSNYSPSVNGYYSFGIFTNYLTRNTLLKGINNTSNDYVFSSSINNERINFGDYYIQDNQLKQNQGEILTGNKF